ncbi:MAG: pyridoxamine 5'-phosphate oxidase family protein [Alphaproteobacteria bacterium]|nr:pyridoxamine 5'-phosphate oxidase family protein [Alphaproteobacteria bacterium]
MVTEALRGQIVSIIDDVQDMTIATVPEDGYPQATTVSYVNDGLTIYLGTTDDTQKARNIARNNKVSFTIDREYGTWDEIESLSMGGIATLVTDPKEQQKAGKQFLEKFPQVAEYFSMETENAVLFRIEPKVISVLDYSKGFGHTELVTL